MIIKERINTEELLKSLQELLAIESVARRDQEKSFGNGVAQALDYTLSLCQRMGFHTKNADGLYGYAEIGEGAEIIGCLGHLDVVPAGDGWHYPPYAGTYRRRENAPTAARLGEARTPLTAPWSSCRQRAGRSPRHIGRCFIHLQSYFCIVLQKLYIAKFILDGCRAALPLW